MTIDLISDYINNAKKTTNPCGCNHFQPNEWRKIRRTEFLRTTALARSQTGRKGGLSKVETLQQIPITTRPCAASGAQDAKALLWQQSDNVPFEQSRNVPLTVPGWWDGTRTTTDDAG